MGGFMDTYDFESINERDVVDYFKGDAISLYMKEVFSYPINTPEENKELARRYKAGDMKAREKLINGNLRLVVNFAFRYRDKVKHMQMLDIIQEGNVGLMRAIEDYDPNVGAFSTYAVIWIKQAIRRAISNKEEEIRKPVHFGEKKKKYISIVDGCVKSGKKVPSDDEFCQILGISAETLLQIKQNTGSVVSINKKIDDDESSELGDFLPSEEKSYANIEKQMAQQQLLIVLKEVLSPLQYFIIYKRILDSESSTLEEVASYFSLTRERIRQLEEKILKKVKPYVEENSEKSKEINHKIKKQEGSLYDKLRTEPILPDNIIKYLYIRDILDEDEKRILYFWYFGKYNFNDRQLSTYLGLTYDDYSKISKSLLDKMQKGFANIKKFKSFRDMMLKNYGSKIFDVDLESDVEVIDYTYLNSQYWDLSWEEIQGKINVYKEHFNSSEMDLLEKFYRRRKRRKMPIFNILADINLTILRLKNTNLLVSKDKLLRIYQRNIDDYNEEQRLFLECYFFRIRPKEEFKTSYKDSALYYRYYYLIERLERTYYNIYCYFEYNFSLKDYKRFRSKYKNTFASKRIELLDLFYGINGKAYSIMEIAEMYGEDYIKMHDMISDAREAAITLYCGNSNRLEINKKLYIPFVNDKIYDFTEETRLALKMYLIDNCDYDEISKRLGVSKYRVSNIITDGIRKIDAYRFGITEVLRIGTKELEEFFNYYKNNFSELERKMLRLKYLEYKANKDIAISLNIPLEKVNRCSRHFNVLYYSYRVKDVLITDEDIIVEVLKHPSESVLSEREYRFASYYFGVKTKYNEDGIRYSQADICKMMMISQNVFYNIYRELINNIKGVKLGIKKPLYCYIKRDELSVLLTDVHLPISKKERDIICYLFELNGYPYKTMDELVSIIGDNKGSIVRRYNRAIINILKYQKKEIEGKLDYDTDIIPNMKYFSLADRNIIEKYFRDGWSAEMLAKECELSLEKMFAIITRLKNYIYELLNNSKVKKFDFDYYLEVRNNIDLPFFGNRAIAIKVFDLFFGMVGKYRLSIPEIIKTLNLPLNTSAVNRVANSMMLCVCKYRDGIKNNIPFTYEDILQYYTEHNHEMDTQHKLYYLRYFDRVNNSKRINGVSSHINLAILMDMFKDRNIGITSLTELDRDMVIRLLKKYYKELNSSTRNELMALFEIPDREFMNGKDINHIYKILDRLCKLEYTNGINLLRLEKVD